MRKKTKKENEEKETKRNNINIFIWNWKQNKYVLMTEGQKKQASFTKYKGI
jgi:hypothetical protein